MAAYTLQLNINGQDLNTIAQAGQNIIVARALTGSPSNVAWLSFSPFERNVVSWDNSYGMYASAALSSGTVQVLSATSQGIPSGQYYNFVNGGFTGPLSGSDAPPTGSYRVFNQMTSAPSFGFGLLQGATVNNVQTAPGPANAEIVPANQFATFTPQNAVYVWLQSNVQSGAIVQLPPLGPGSSKAVSSRATFVQFQSPSTLTYQYTATTGTFVATS